MKYTIPGRSVAIICVFGLTLFLIACNESSSPEGRMSIRIERLQKEMIDSLRQQNRAILDSLGNIRKELNEMKARTK